MTRLHVPDMTCGHCRASIEAALSRADAGARASVDLPGRLVEVDSALPEGAIIAALAEIGFPATPA